MGKLSGFQRFKNGMSPENRIVNGKVREMSDLGFFPPKLGFFLGGRLP